VANVSVSLRLAAEDGQPLTSFHIPTIVAGGCQDVSFTWDTAGKESQASHIPVFVIADMADSIPESKEGNNVRMGQIWLTKIADFTDSGVVDLEDLLVFAHEWLATLHLASDIVPTGGGDGLVNLLDFAKFAENWLSESQP